MVAMKRKVFTISPEYLKRTLEQDADYHYQILDGIPKDAKIVQCGFIDESSYRTPAFYMTVEHESFPEIQEGTIAEPSAITVRTLHCPADNGNSTN
jgi:hypothetical protein